MAIDKIFDGAVDGIADNLFNSVSNSVSEIKAMQQRKAAENVQLVVQALKKIDADIREKYDGVTETFDKRIASIKDGRDGKDGKNGLDGVNGKDGRDGKDGRNGRDGLTGPRGFDGPKGLDGKDGRDGEDGVSVTDAHIDFDGSLIISLSSGRVINVGEVVAADIAEKIKVITNGGGTSQPVLDKLASLQEQIDLIASALVYKGTWNASTNTPTLTSSVGTANSFYIISVAGTTNLNGTSNWGVGDWAVFNGSVWQRVEGGAVGNFTDLTVSGTTTLSNLTASTALALNASKEVVSVTNTGTGNNVLATSPTLVTPALGTPSSATLTNATGLPLSSGVTGTLPIANGGTGQTTANTAFNALAPSQASNSGKYLTTNGTDTSWATLSGLGTVTSVSGTGTVNGLTLTGTVTTSGSLTLGGTLSGISNSSLTNSSITINGTATSLGGSINVGTVTSVGATVPSFLSITGSPITSSGTLAISLSGTALPTTSGGTGLTSFTANGVVYASSSSALTTGSALTFDGSKLVNTGYNKSTYQVSTGAVGTFESVGGGYLTYDGETGASVYSRSNASAENTLTFRATAFSFRVAGTQVASLNSSTFSLQNIPILLSGSTSGYTGFAAPATSNFTIYTLPSTDGTSGQSLTTNGSGTLSWASGTGGTVTSVSGTGTVSGISLSGTVTSSGNLTLGGALDLSAYSGAGAFTTLSASSTVTLSGGIANGVLYLNGSKQATSGSVLTFDGTNLGLGVSPNANWATYNVLQIGEQGVISGFASGAGVLNTGANFYWDGSGYRYLTSNPASLYQQNAGGHNWRIASSGTAGNSISFTQAMTLDTSGNLGIGTTSPDTSFDRVVHIQGTNTAISRFTATTYGTSATDGGYVGFNFGGMDVWQYEASYLRFGTNNTERMRIDSSGNLGIGTSSPAAYAKLTVAGTAGAQTGASQQIVVNAPTTTAGQGAGIRLTAASGAKEAVAILGVVNQASGNAGAMTFHVYNGGADVPEYMRLDSSGNLGLGVTPSAWGRGKAFEQGSIGSAIWADTSSNDIHDFLTNAYLATSDLNSGWRYAYNGYAVRYEQISGTHRWFTAASGTAGNAITFTQAMTLSAAGQLGLGTTSPQNYSNYRILHVAGPATDGSGLLYFTNSNNSLVGLANADGANSVITFGSQTNHAVTFKTNDAERARIDSSGNLLVGTTSTLISANEKVSIDGGAINTLSLKTSGGASSWDIFAWNSATSGNNNFIEFGTEAGYTVRGSIVYNRAGGVILYNTTSDYRAKDISGPVTNSGALIDSTPVYMGKMKGATQERPMFIAHETPSYAHTGVKDAVDADGNPVYQQMDASALIPVMWAEIQSLRKRLADAGI